MIDNDFSTLLVQRLSKNHKFFILFYFMNFYLFSFMMPSDILIEYENFFIVIQELLVKFNSDIFVLLLTGKNSIVIKHIIDEGRFAFASQVNSFIF